MTKEQRDVRMLLLRYFTGSSLTAFDKHAVDHQITHLEVVCLTLEADVTRPPGGFDL